MNQLDVGMWAQQAEYVITKNPKQFDFAVAYAHPGATIIDGVALTHFLFGLPYSQAIIYFLSFADALIIAFMVVLCYQITPKTWWWMGTLALFTVNYMNDFATPTTAVSSLLVALLLLVTLRFRFWWWAIVAGLALATRVDIGLFIVGLGLYLSTRLSLQKVVLLAFGVFFVFCLVNPYMWYMPVQHLKDLLYKMTWHYTEFTPSFLSIYEVVLVSGLAIVSLFLAGGIIWQKKQVKLLIPLALFLSLIFVTVIGIGVIVTSSYQASRYLTPYVSIWELLLPLFLFTLAKQTRHYRIVCIITTIFIAVSQTYLSIIDSNLMLGV